MRDKLKKYITDSNLNNVKYTASETLKKLHKTFRAYLLPLSPVKCNMLMIKASWKIWVSAHIHWCLHTLYFHNVQPIVKCVHQCNRKSTM